MNKQELGADGGAEKINCKNEKQVFTVNNMTGKNGF